VVKRVSPRQCSKKEEEKVKVEDKQWGLKGYGFSFLMWSIPELGPLGLLCYVRARQSDEG